jgi:hypothetical protein
MQSDDDASAEGTGSEDDLHEPLAVLAPGRSQRSTSGKGPSKSEDVRACIASVPSIVLHGSSAHTPRSL